MSAPLLERIDAVVIGASAGGVDALGLLLPALRADLRAAVFVVVHLPRERPSLLVDIFQPKCAVPVREAEDKQAVQPGTVYFAPPDYHLLIDAGPQLALSTDEPVHYSRPSIDVLFESAALIYRRHLLGIVLSGGNDDGSDGLATVLRAGGSGIVQLPQSAAVPLMPAAALQRSPQALALPLPQIAAQLGALDAGARA